MPRDDVECLKCIEIPIYSYDYLQMLSLMADDGLLLMSVDIYREPAQTLCFRILDVPFS